MSTSLCSSLCAGFGGGRQVLRHGFGAALQEQQPRLTRVVFSARGVSSAIGSGGEVRPDAGVRDGAAVLPRATRNVAEQRRRQTREKLLSIPPPRPEISPKRKARRGTRLSSRHTTDLEDLGSPVGGADAAGSESPRPATPNEDLGFSPQIKRLMRRPVAELPRKPSYFVKNGAPMTAEDLAHDAPSIFVESRTLIDDVLERRQAAQSAPDYVAPDTPFWRLPPKVLQKKAVKWQDEPEHGDVDAVGGSAAQPADAEEAAERLKGIVDLKRPGKKWQVDALAPVRCASDVLATDADDAKGSASSSSTSNSGQRSPGEYREGTAHRADGTSKRKDPAENLVAMLRRRAEDYAQTGVDPDIKESLESALRHHPGTERAARLREMRACTKDFESLVVDGTASVNNCNELIRAYAVQGRMDEAMRIHDTMKLHGFEPDDGTFVSLLAGASHLKDAVLARKLFLKMREQLISATPKIYATLIRAHVRAGDLASGFGLLRKMEDERVQPDVVVHTVLIDGLVKEGKLERAWEQFHSIRTWKLISPDEVLFTVMIKACAQAEEPERALNMLDDLRMSGLYPTDLTYGEVIHAVATSPDHARKAFDFFRQMQAEDMPLNAFVFGKLIVACRSLGDVRKAREVVEDMRKHEVHLTPSMYYDLIGLFANAMGRPRATDNERLQNLRCAWHVVAEARQQCKELNGTRLLNEVMGVYIAGGFCQYAVDMLKQYAVFGVQPDATSYKQLLEMLGRTLKDVPRFFVLWDNLPKDLTIPSEIYHLALEMGLESKSARRTCLVLEEMYKAQVFPSPQLADKLAKAGRNVMQIHMLVGKFIALNRDTKAAEARRETALLQTHMDEREMELAEIGRTVRTPTPEQEARARHFESLRKRGWFKRPWLPLGEYIASKQKGGEAYAQRHDKPRPNLLAA